LILKEENGFLKPKILKNNDKKEYDMKTSECHGLKELITLLSLLYNDEYNCLIIDEPELHLHPQFQAYFLQEIRKIAGDPRIDPSRKCFFLITHSPYFIDIKTIDDLKNCLVFQPNKCPRFIHELETDDYARVNHLLPRLNTHHKQFFFASRPIFVEGYSDQQLFALIQEKRGRFLGASGSCIIDINGKDELDLFYKICSNLNIDGQYICDLDALFHGKLRQSLSLDSRCKKHLQDQGLDIDLMKAIGLLETKIGECLTDLESSLEKTTEFSEPIAALSQTLKEAKGDKLLATKRYIFLIALLRMRSELECLIPDKRDHLNFILSRSQKLIEVLKKCGFFLLPQGALENYLPSYKGNPYKIPENDKKDIFEQERRFIIDTDLSDEDFISRYGEVISILDQASLSKKINLDVQLNYVISEWIHRVQMAHRRNSSLTIESIKEDLTLEWTKYLRIFELIDFSANQSEFKCKIKLKPSIDPLERAIEFDNKCVAANFVLN
jgi:hypothetical protein